MIPIENYIELALKKLKRMEPYNCLDIRTYKRDRKVIIEKLNNGFNVYEDGFYVEEFKSLDIDSLRYLLKEMIKKEFPRSNIVRFYELKNKGDNNESSNKR